MNPFLWVQHMQESKQSSRGHQPQTFDKAGFWRVDVRHRAPLTALQTGGLRDVQMCRVTWAELRITMATPVLTSFSGNAYIHSRESPWGSQLFTLAKRQQLAATSIAIRHKSLVHRETAVSARDQRYWRSHSSCAINTHGGRAAYLGRPKGRSAQKAKPLPVKCREDEGN